MSCCKNQIGLLCWKTEESEKNLRSSFPCNVCCTEEWDAWINCCEARDESDRTHSDECEHPACSPSEHTAITAIKTFLKLNCKLIIPSLPRHF